MVFASTKKFCGKNVENLSKFTHAFWVFYGYIKLNIADNDRVYTTTQNNNLELFLGSESLQDL